MGRHGEVKLTADCPAPAERWADHGPDSLARRHGRPIVAGRGPAKVNGPWVLVPFVVYGLFNRVRRSVRIRTAALSS